jgi:DNA-directed RNA polymerase II subunit RPB4
MNGANEPHRSLGRRREPIQGDEEAGAELKLGEFQDVDALTHSEAALVINALVQKRKMDRKNVNETEYVDFPFFRSWSTA